MEDTERITKKQLLRELMIYFLVWCMFLGTPFSVVMANPNPAPEALPTGATYAPGDISGILPGTNRIDIADVVNGAVINWENFDIGSLSTVQFHQVSNDAFVLNTVNLNGIGDGAATGIAGNLLANGGVFVVNPRGLQIAPTAYISANNFVGAAMKIDADEFKDFANGITNEIEFNRALFQQGKVINKGYIVGQQIALVGKQVQNLGTIRTNSADGVIVLAAGNKVKLGHNGSDVFVDVSVGILGNRVVDNAGSIGAGQITNNGDGTFDVTDETGGNVILAAGDIYSTAMSGLASLRAEAKNDITLAGDVDTTGDIELLAGDGGWDTIDTKKLDAGGNVTAKAGGNITLGDDVTAGGSVEILAGQSDGIFGIGAAAQLNVNGSITAGDIRLKNGQDVEPGEESYSGIYVSGDLTANAGDVVVEAVHDVVLEGDVWASNNVFLNGDEDGWGDPRDEIGPDGYNPIPYGGGDVIAQNVAAGGGIEIRGNAIQINGDVDAGANLLIAGRSSEDPTGDTLGFYDEGGWGDVYAKGTLDAGGNILILATGQTWQWVEDGGSGGTGTGGLPNPGGGNGNSSGRWNTGSSGGGGGNVASGAQGQGNGVYHNRGMAGTGGSEGHYEYGPYSVGSIYLDGDVTATGDFADGTGDIILLNNTYTAPYVTIKAGRDVVLANSEEVDPPENAEFLTGDTELTIIAGAKDGVDDGRIYAENTTISVTGSKLTLQQDPTLDVADFMFDNQSDTHLTLVSDVGSVIADDTKSENAANKWDSIGAKAAGDITLAGSGYKAIQLGDSGVTDMALVAGGNVNISGTTVRNDGDYADGSIEAGLNVNIVMSNDIKLGGGILAGENINLQAGDGWNDDIDVDQGLFAWGDVTARAGDDIELGSVQAGGAVDITSNTSGYGFFGGMVTVKGHVRAETGDINLQTGAGGLDDIDVDGYLFAGGNVTVEAGDDIELGSVEALGAVDITSNMCGHGLLGGEVTVKGDVQGDTIDIEAGSHIEIWGDATSRGDMTLTADADKNDRILFWPIYGDIKAYGDLTSTEGSITLDASDNTIYLYGDVTAAENVTLEANTRLKKGEGDQVIAAGETVTAEGYVRKTTSGDMFLIGGTGEDQMAIDLQFGEEEEGDEGPAASVCAGNLWILGQGHVQISGDVTTFGEGCCCEWDATGGVAIVSSEGSIFTGSLGDPLNIGVSGYSDHLAGKGVFDIDVDPEDVLAVKDSDQRQIVPRAAIVIGSKESLWLGSKATLTAEGVYYDPLSDPGDPYYADVDDRSAINFMTSETVVNDALRNPGDPFDLAIYVASLEGDVMVESAVSIMSREPLASTQTSDVPPRLSVALGTRGAMVVDALTNVSFGEESESPFLDSLAAGQIGNRLEVVSRVSEWLSDAIGRLPFREDLPLPDGYTYVMRGAGGFGGPAWVLEDPPPTPPLAEFLAEEAEETEFGEGGCPALMQWLAGELGVDEETLQVYVQNAFAYSTDIQPCDMCARLKDAATTLEDVDGTQIAAMAQVVNEFAATPGPPSPAQMASIATALADHVDDGTYYATAGDYVDAVVQYVGILNTEMGLSTQEATTAVAKYTDSIADAGVAAYVAARLAQIGG